MKWISSDGTTSDGLRLQLLQTVRIGCFKFTFIGLSEPKSHDICRLINAMLDNGCIEIGLFAQMLQRWRVAYKLQFSAREELTEEENLAEYAEEFLPFYKELLDKGIMVEL